MRTLSLLLLLCWIPGCFAQPAAHFSHEILETSIQSATGFEPVTDEPGVIARFFSAESGYTIRLLQGEIELRFDHGMKFQVAPDLVRISLSGAKLGAPQFYDPLPGAFHYYSGRDPNRWRTDVHRFREVRFADVYPGIDLLFHSRGQQLEFDFNVAAGQDASAIGIRVEGATVREAEGNLQIATPGGNVALLQKPELYQLSNGKRQRVAGAYVVRGPHEVGFSVGDYDRRLPLVIDPALIYSTMVANLGNTAAINGNEIDALGSIVVDAAGAAYVAGVVNDAAFVSKFNSTGTAMIYTTFLGTFSHDLAITVDSAGNAYMVGVAVGSNLVITPGAFSNNSVCATKAILVSNCDAPFAVKLDPQGKIVYCTYLVTPDAVDTAGPKPASIAVDATGALYIAGGLDDPSSVHLTPPTMPGLTTTAGAFQTVKKSNSNLFAMKLHPDGSSVDFATFIGGSGIDRFGGMVIDSTGVAYMSGGTTSTDFPITPGAFQNQNPGSSAFYLKLANDGSGLLYSTFLGAPGIHSSGLSIALDSTKAAYIDGETDGPGFPTTPGVFRTNVSGPAPGPDGLGSVFNYSFLSKFDPAGNLAFSTYVGDAVTLPKFIGAFDAPYPRNSLAVDSSGAYMVGRTQSRQSLHSIANPSAFSSMFVTKMDLAGTALIYSTFFGSDQVATQLFPSSMALDGSQNVYVAGGAGAFAPVQACVPTTAGAFQSEVQFNGNFAVTTAFLAKIASSLGAPVPVPIPRAYDLNILLGRFTPPPAPIQLSNFGDADLTLGPITITGTNASDFSQTNNCPAVLPAGGECLIQVDFAYAEVSAVNPRTATMKIAFGGGLPSQTVALSAPGGVPNVQLFNDLTQVNSLDFGTVAIGSQVTKTLGLFNPGSAPAVVLQILTTGDFSTPAVSRSVQGVGRPMPSPVFIPFFQVPITFKPTAFGPQSGQLIVRDAAFNSPHIVQLTGNGSGDFSLQPSASPTSVTVHAGGTATYTLVLANAAGFSGSGTFSCSGLPTGTTCTATPSTFSFSGIASSQNISFAITTTAASAAANSNHGWWAFGAFFAAMFLLPARARRYRGRYKLAALAICIGLAACGGGSSQGGPPPGPTPPGTYALTLTAGSGSVQHSATVTLVVQ